MAREPGGDRGNDGGIAEHPDLDGADREIVKYRVDLGGDEFRRHPVNCGDALGVLGSERGDHGRAKTPSAENVFRSAWMPAPPLKSEPAMVTAIGVVMVPAASLRRRERLPVGPTAGTLGA